MGILKVGAGAAASVLEDSWREYFYCPSLEADVLAKKGENRRSGRSRTSSGTTTSRKTAAALITPTGFPV